MESHDLGQDTAERVQEIMDDLGVDEDDAIEIEESL
jgi:ribosome assembly protein YihI (activator of Der GTPase)